MALGTSRRYNKIYLLGDSLTEFSFDEGHWGANLAHAYSRKCDVVNRGFCGYTSRYLRCILPKLLSVDNEHGDIFAATIMLGSNDSVAPDLDARAVPLAEYEESLGDIIQMCLKASIRHVVVITPPACDDVVWSAWLQRNKNAVGSHYNARVAEYAKACVRVANANSVHVVDLFGDMMREENWKNLLCDGLHLAAEGSRFLVSRLKSILDPLVLTLPMIFPEWNCIDPDMPHQTLL